MGVDTSVTVGVGFLVDLDALARYRKTNHNSEDFSDEETIETLTLAEGLGYVAGGSYYSSDPITYCITINRLTTSRDVNDLPGGIIGLNKPAITAHELTALTAVADLLGQGTPTIGQFMSVLWF